MGRAELHTVKRLQGWTLFFSVSEILIVYFLGSPEIEVCCTHARTRWQCACYNYYYELPGQTPRGIPCYGLQGFPTELPCCIIRILGECIDALFYVQTVLHVIKVPLPEITFLPVISLPVKGTTDCNTINKGYMLIYSNPK